MSSDPAKPLVVRTEPLDPQAAQWLSERVNLVECPFSDSRRLGQLLPDALGLLVRTYTRVDAALLDRAPRLRVVARAGVGLENIDIPACSARNIRVVSTPDANSSAVAELVFAVLLDAIRPRLFLDKPVTPDRWASLRAELLGRRQLEDLTLGVLGLGRVGSRVARIGSAFGMRVLYHDLRDIPHHDRCGAKSVAFDRLLSQADVLSVHVDGRPDNRLLLGANQFPLLKPDAIFINASRGMVVDHAALARFLREHPAASAILDVHEPEPITAENPLLGLPNAHLMPHIGAATAKAHANMSWVVRDLWRVLQGEPPEHPAN
jgi:phosphoglycerate dehydrogenase-like enzyme